MKNILLILFVLMLSTAVYAASNPPLGSSTSVTSPQVASDATTGLYSAGAAQVDISISGSKNTGFITNSVDMSSDTGSLILPSGTSGQRPSTTAGQLRYNSGTPGLEAYYSGAWNALGSGGSVSVTASTPDIVVNPSPGTGTFTVGTTELINAQTGTTYTINATDMGKTVTTSNAGAVAVTLPVATTSGFGAGTSFSLINIGAGTATITPTTSTINGSSTLVLTSNQSAYIISNGTNYFAFLGATSGVGTGTVTNVATTSPLGGGPITTTGTITCSTCVVASSPSAGIAHFAGSTQTVTSSAVNLASGDVTGVLPTSNGGSSTNQTIRSITYVIDGGGSAITTGVKGTLLVPFACTINSASLISDQTGSIVVDIWKKAFAGTLPTVANTITASALPTLSSAITEQDTTLTGWTTSVSANDMITYNVNSASTVTRVSVVLKCTAN